VVFDPGAACRQTLKLKEVPWRSALEASLRACALGREQEEGVLRIAPMARLVDEAQVSPPPHGLEGDRHGLPRGHSAA
jgi:hypothetical protein